MTDERILVIGTGALGTLFASKLASAGNDVTILGTWMEGLNALRARGAQIQGEQPSKVKVTSSYQELITYKHSLVLVKSDQTDRVARGLNQCMAGDGITITLQNGLGNKEKLVSILGENRVISGVTTVGAYLLAPGLVRMSGRSSIWMERKPRVHNLAKILQRCGFSVNLVDDIQSRIWRKLIINCAINPLTGILRVKNGELLKDPLAVYLLERLVAETVFVSKAIDIKLRTRDPLEMVKKVTHETGENTSSMLQDILRGIPTEIDAINGEIIRIAEMHSIKVPVNSLVYSLIRKAKHCSSMDIIKMLSSS